MGVSDEYRPRPNDDLVEPLFGGIHGADEVTQRAIDPPRGRGHALVVILAGLVIAAVWWAST